MNPEPDWHGTWHGYQNRSCRCDACYEAGRAYRSNPRYKLVSKTATVRWRYKLSWRDLTKMLEDQGGGCAICDTPISIIPDEPNPAAIDHDHSCCPDRARSCGSCIRGLLCRECNQGIGKLGEDPERLKRALAYLAR